MSKKLLLSFLSVLGVTFVIASPVSKSKARSAAVNWYIYSSAGSTTDFSIADSTETTYNGLTTFYTYIFNAGGFVMVSADDAVTPVIGFSTNEAFDKNHIPENAQYFFDQYSLEISKIVAANLDNTETLAEWDKIATADFDYSRSPMAVTPMLATTWNQNSPYNNLCPGGVPTGCVATAMAQVMKKWNYPATGTGSHSYVHATYGTQSANFGATTYQWANMVNSYAGTTTAAQKTAVATLMYHCGVSVNMDYAPAGSGAYTQAVPNAFVNNFNYQPSCEVKYKSLYATDLLWQNMIFAEMDQGRPCMLAGDDNGTAGTGHEFVCDGYNGSNKVHINWGWGGTSNGYFYLTALNPSGSNFSSNRAAVIRIRPFSSLVPIADFTASNTIPAAGAPVDFTDQSLNNPTSWSWTFDGGSPSTSTAQNPAGITFATNGYHLVSLTVSNANGTDIKTKERYIKVGGAATVWTKQNTAFAQSSRGVDEIDIVDANTVWAKAYDGANPTGYIREFTKTTDGGTTWTPGTITFTNSQNYGASNIYAFSATTAYACMFPLSGTGGAIVKTTDGGTTWTVQNTAPFTNSWANFVHFFDVNNGVAMGDPTATTASDFMIYTTANGGATWTQVSTASLPNSLAGEAGIVNEFAAVGNTIWFTTNKGRIYKSTNKGVSWTVTTTGLTNSYQMKFKDANTGIIVLDTLPYTMRKTTDGGSTWSAITPTGYLVKRPQLAFVPGTASTWFDVAANPGNGSSKSLDDCASFVNVDTGSVQFLSVSFFDSNTGWAGSFNTNATDGGIYKWNSNPPIIATASNTNVSCFGLSDGSATITASGGLPPFIYAWSPGGATTATATGLAAGTYTCTITDAASVSTTQTVTVNQPTVLTASIGSPTNVLCFGSSTGSAMATATGGTGSPAYSWMPAGGASASATGLAAGTYTVTVTDANSCATTATITITEPVSPLTAAATATNVLCKGGLTGSVMATATGGTGAATYAWSPSGATTASATALPAGTYTVTATDANGCITTATTTVTEPPMLITSTGSTDETAANNGTASAMPSGGTAPYAYSWSPGGATTATATGLTAGTYTVTVTDANGCSDVQAVVVNSAMATGIAAADLQSSVRAYPNPNGGTFSLNIMATANTQYTLRIVNAIGQIVYNGSLSVNTGTTILPLSIEDMEDGLYILQVQSNERTVIIPLSKMKQ